MKKNQPTGFGYRRTAWRFVARYRDGSWDGGRLTRRSTVRLSEAAGVIQYAETCFEGLKAYRTADGGIACFRPDLNGERLKSSCLRLAMPPLPDGMFLSAVQRVVRANARVLPPFGSGGSLYLRPTVFGTGAVLGVKPAETYEFRLFGSPVASYFAGGERLLSLRVSDYDRAAPRGTGHVKAGLNYAMSLYPLMEAHAEGFDENIYLDAATRTWVEETGGANLLFLQKDGTVVTPHSDSILPSITRRSLGTVAGLLGIPWEERRVRAEEFADFCGCALCGTAAVLSMVGRITWGGRVFSYPASPVFAVLRERLLAIQHGTEAAPDGWIFRIS